MRQWKLSPMDLESLDKWDEYTEAEEAMFFYTDTADPPWTVIKSNDKKRARLEAVRFVLSRFDHPGKDHDVVGEPDPQIVGSAAPILETDKCPPVIPRTDDRLRAAGRRIVDGPGRSPDSAAAAPCR